MARRSAIFTVIPVKSTNGRQLSLVDALQKMQGDTLGSSPLGRLTDMAPETAARLHDNFV